MKLIIKILSITTILILLLSSTVLGLTTQYVWSNQTNSINTQNTVETSVNLSTTTSLKLESGAAILIEQSTGQVLFEHNSHEQLRPASVTKIMSILLIMEALDCGKIQISDKVPCSSNARSMGGSQIWLNENEELNVDEMLKAICVVSANDCVVAMAEYLCGSQEAFVKAMNEKANELGMNDTCFKNCHGIDEDGHVTSAYDIALMSRELLTNHPDITNYTTIWMDTLRDGKSQLVNTNKLVRNYNGCTGLKTGSTSLALYNLAASASRNDLSLIAVIMKAPSTSIRFSEATKLLDYGFSNFSYTKMGNSNDIIKNISVDKGIQNNINAILKDDVGFIVNNRNNSNITQSINLTDNISAPITAGQKLGEVSYIVNDEILKTVDIVAETDVKKLSLVNMTTYLYKEWFCMCR